GACQTGGTVIDWVMRAEGVRFRHAVELLREGLPSLDAFPEKPRGRQQGNVAKQTTTPKLTVLLEPSAEDDVLMRQVVDYYHETLKQSPEALAYLEKRGLRSSEMVERFHLGFANRTLGYRLPQKNRKTGAEVHTLTHRRLVSSSLRTWSVRRWRRRTRPQRRSCSRVWPPRTTRRRRISLI